MKTSPSFLSRLFLKNKTFEDEKNVVAWRAFPCVRAYLNLLSKAMPSIITPKAAEQTPIYFSCVYIF